jgi:hypothetical protein
MIFLVFILIILLALLGYGCWNLLKQVEQLENQCIMYIDIISEIRDKVLDVEIELKEIDIKGSFEADDEVGFVFKEIKQLSAELVETVNKAYEYTESE